MHLFALLGAVVIINHTPSHWYMSCARWREQASKILVDQRLPEEARVKLVLYLRRKVKGKCDLIVGN